MLTVSVSSTLSHINAMRYFFTFAIWVTYGMWHISEWCAWPVHVCARPPGFRANYKGSLSFFCSRQPAHLFCGVDNHNYVSGRAISEQHFSERAGLWTAWTCGRRRAQLWGAVERGEGLHVLCTSIHQYIELTVVCGAFVLWIVVFLLCQKARVSLVYTLLIGSGSGT